MPEGGFFQWASPKAAPQKRADSEEDASLPTPPAGFEWKKDAKREWRLCKKDSDPPSLITETVVDALPAAEPRASSREEDEWEIVSERSTGHSSENHVLVPKAGSVRSIASVESSHASGTSPFKIQRTLSSSTIDSTDNALGPAGKGILGIDYVEHVILPTDTLQGLCLAYKISTTRLRQANHFSGNSLLLAPKKLVIPISKKALRSGFIRAQDTDAKEYKLHAFLAEFADLTLADARAYLELGDWDLKEALQSAREDKEWEQDIDTCALKSGEIRITMNMKGGVPVGFATQGAGLSGNKEKKEEVAKAVKELPRIASKCSDSDDLVNAASEHGNFGVELKPIRKRPDYTED